MTSTLETDAGAGSAANDDTATIVRAVIVAGHDGAAELFVEVAYPGGGTVSLSLAPGPTEVAIAAAGVTDVADLVGRPWQLLVGAAAAFALWTDLIGRRLAAEGVAADRAEELAMLVTTSIEGAIIVARASRDVKPLDVVQRQLRALLKAEAPERNSR